MSLPTIFFTTDEATAEKMELNHNLPPHDVCEMNAINFLTVSTLWAIMDGKPWAEERLDQFSEVFAREEVWLHRIPEAFVYQISNIGPARRAQISEEWAVTEEMRCKPSEAEEVVRGISEIALRALVTQRPMFLYTCL